VNETKLLSVSAIIASIVVPLAFAAHTHVATPSTWSINLKESDFGSGPSLKSDITSVTTDTDKWLEYSEVAVQSDGTTLKTSWSGPEDGSMHPITGVPGGQAGFNTALDTAMFTFQDGSKMKCDYSVSPDKKKYIEKCLVTMPDGKTMNQTYVYDHVK
jgi:hypothetical protein